MSQTRSRPDWWKLTEQHAASAGVDSELLARVAGVESNFRNVDNQSGPGGTATSSATGPFQIIERTWNGLATNNPRLGLTNRRDVNQQAMAAPYLFREKLDTLKHLTKRSEVSDGQAYLAWFLGAGGAARVINAAGDSSINSVVDAAALRANATVFNKKGSEITTAEQLLAWADRKMGGTPSPRTGTQTYDQGPQFPRGEVVDVSMSTPRSSIADSQRRALEDAQEVEAYGLARGAGEAIWAEQGLNWAFKGMGAPPPDPDFRLDKKQLEEAAQGFSNDHIPYLAAAHSEANLQWRMQQLKSDLETEAKLGAMGATGTGFRIVGAILDPVGWAAAAATGGAGLSVKAGRIAKIGIMAGQGAAANMMAEIPMALSKPTWTKDQLLYSAAAGAVMGAAVGGYLGRKTDMSTEIDAVATSLNNSRKALAPPRGDGSAGAMATPNRVEPIRGDTHDWMSEQFMDAQGRPVFSGVRFDSTNRLKTSENPVHLGLGNRMGVDATGNRNKAQVSGRAITEDKQIVADRMDMAYKETYWSTSNDFIERNEIPGMSRKDAEAFFRIEVTRAMRSRDALEEFDPAVKRMADKVAKINADYLKLAQGDHRSLDGSMRKPIPGFEDLEINEAYVPRYTNFEKFRDMVGKYGDKEMSNMVYSAIRAMNPDAAEAISKKIAKGYIKRLRQVDAGQEDVSGRMFATLDMEDMKAHLREIGLDDAEIEWAIRRPVDKDAKKTGTPRGKRRTLFDEGFKMDMRRADGSIDKDVSIMDMFHDDNLYIFNRYNREMSGNIAMSRLRIENPNWRPGEDDLHPQYLVDGIYSDSDWQTLMTKGRAIATDKGGKAKETLEKDEAAANFLYDTIRGRPQAMDTGSVAQFMRMARDFNFSRVMGQVGFAQLPDLGALAGLGGRIAFKSMPALRQLSRDIKTGKIKDNDMNFLVHLTGKGSDWMRGKGRMMTDDQGVPLSSTGSWKNRLEYGLARGARATGAVSGMTPIITFINRWAAQGAMWKIAEAAHGTTKLSRQRMNILGLGEDMQEKVLQSIRDGNARMGGRGKKGDMIEHMDLDNWDPQVRGAFEFAITRWTKRIAQDGDPGQVNAMLESGPGKLLTQFRTFGIKAWTQNTLHNVHMRDGEAFMSALVSSVLAVLTWQGQTYLRSIGRDDREAYLEENLSWGRTMAAGVGRIGFASMLPGMIDTALDIAPVLDPVFNVRSTGLSNAGLESVPTGDVLKRSYKGLKDLGEIATGESDLTQAKFRNAFGLLMFQNTLPMMWMGNAISAELPER